MAFLLVGADVPTPLAFARRLPIVHIGHRRSLAAVAIHTVPNGLSLLIRLLTHRMCSVVFVNRYRIGRGPKIAVPTRTIVDPFFIAIARSAVIPAEKSNCAP